MVQDLPSPPDLAPPPARYRNVVLVLLALAGSGLAASLGAAVWLNNVVFLDAAILLLIGTGALAGVFIARHQRTLPSALFEVTPDAAAAASEMPALEEPPTIAPDAEPVPKPARGSQAWALAEEVARRVRGRVGSSAMSDMSVAIGALALFGATIAAWFSSTPPLSLDWRMAAAVAVGCLVAAWLAMTAANYLEEIDRAAFPEAVGLCHGARVVAWYFVASAVSVVLVAAEWFAAIRVLHVVALSTVVMTAIGLLYDVPVRPGTTWSADFPPLSALGSRPNLLAALLDAAERQLGIDLRSTWALTVVRRSLEPLVLGMCLLGWLTTSFTVVRTDEQVLVERLGAPVTGPPLGPGLHLHWPWPIDRTFPVPVTRVHRVAIGHEAEAGDEPEGAAEAEEEGPEDVLWARMHEANEYTLLLGDGRDLITIDAAVQYRIKDARAWHYHGQNPADALRAIAYRAVMRSTVSLTLADALWQNVVTLTEDMRGMVQRDADALGLGVEIVAFTVAGMHPPVAVAEDYQGVVSAELRKAAAIVEAQAYRNSVVPSAEAAAVAGQNQARAEAAEMLGRGAGEAWAFRSEQSGYRTSQAEFMFRRRLEALEQGLAGRPFTVIDTRIPRDGGELWLTR